MTMLEETIYNAFLSAGVKKEEARAVAEAINAHADTNKKLDHIIDELHHLRQSDAIQATQIKMMQWLVGGVGFALIAAVFIKLFE